MKATLQTLIATMMLGAWALIGSTSAVHAGDDYVVIQDKEVVLGNNPVVGKPPQGTFLAKTFALPNNVNRELPAVLQLTAFDVYESWNAIYLNPNDPPAKVCQAGNPDPNVAQRIMYLNVHDVDNANEWFTNHRVVKGSLLKVGSNLLVICSRDKTGQQTGDLDDFIVESIILHHKTTP